MMQTDIGDFAQGDHVDVKGGRFSGQPQFGTGKGECRLRQRIIQQPDVAPIFAADCPASGQCCAGYVISYCQVRAAIGAVFDVSGIIYIDDLF